MDADRKTAYSTLLDVEIKDAYSNLALNHNIAENRPASPAFVRELVYGVLENQRYLDHILGGYMKTPVRKLRAGDRILLRMGLYQLLFMDSVPEYAAVNESVALARKYCRGRESFINGVLRSFLRDKEAGKPVELPDKEKDPAGYFSTRYSYEPWIIEMWLEAYEPAFLEDLLKASNEAPKLSIRPNLMKISKADLKAKLERKGYVFADGHMASDALLLMEGTNLLSEPEYEQGLFAVQDESSMLAVEKLAPEPGDFVMDICAAPGGKSLYMAEKMGNQGTILSGDIYDKKLEQLRQMARRSGIDMIKTRTWDGAVTDESLVGKADKLMIDVPCSGLGVIRKKPEIKYKKFTEDMSILPKKQFDILTASSRYLKSGGLMVYSTCTIAARENEQVVRAFLRKNPDFEEVESIQLLPHIHKTNGFYICKLRRK